MIDDLALNIRYHGRHLLRFLWESLLTGLAFIIIFGPIGLMFLGLEALSK